MKIQEQLTYNIVNMNPNFKEAFIIIGITTLIYILKKEIFKKFISKLINKAHITFIKDIYPLVNRFSSILLWLFSSCLVLTKLGINIQTLMATLGASSLLIAYGFKDSFINFIAGLAIFIYRPFRIKDKIKLQSGEEVEVLDIGISLSKFRFYDKDTKKYGILFIQNSCLIKNKILNYTYAKELKKEKYNG